MKRLVYSPKAFVYVKCHDGQLRDLTSYVVNGRVHRKVNQVSSAEIELRNPHMIFTDIEHNGHPAFKPMDPITIFLQRVNKHPVQVFTGFLDETPYLELFPGTVSLRASCTLKKLQYTFFDPALPYMVQWLKTYGWDYNVQTGEVSNRSQIASSNLLTTSSVNPSTKALTMIGDSLSQGSTTQVKKNLKDWKINQNNLVGRTTQETFNAVNASNTQFADTVLVQSGTNDWGDVENFKVYAEKLVNKIGAQRRIIWVNTYNRTKPKATKLLNAAIAQLAGKHSNIAVLDWNGFAKAKKIQVDQYGHPSDGYGQLGDFLVDDGVQGVKTVKGKDKSERGANTTLTDGSLGALLYAILKQIGHWQSDQVYIEKLPDDLLDKIAAMYVELQEANKPLVEELQGLLADLVGTGSAGTGSLGGDPNDPGASGSLSGKVTVKGVTATLEQRRHIENALGVAYKMNADAKAIEALVCAGIGESSFSNVVNSLGYGGVFQGQVAVDGSPNWFANDGPYKRTRRQAWYFLRGGLGYQAGGALYLVRTAPSLTPGDIATRVEASGEPGTFYNVFLPEAKRIIAAFNPDEGTLDDDEKKEKDDKERTNNGNAPEVDRPNGSLLATTSSTNEPGRAPGKKERNQREEAEPSDKIYAPIAGSPTTYSGVYGEQRETHIHAGLDIPVVAGTKCFAPCDGTIKLAQTTGFGDVGGMIHLQGARGTTLEGKILGWGHVQRCNYKAGDQVKAGDWIADSGWHHVHLIYQPTPTGDLDGSGDPRPTYEALSKGKQSPDTDGTSQGGGEGGGNGGATGGSVSGQGDSAFATMLAFPSIAEIAEAVGLTGAKSLMNDQPLLPFIQQICGASMRNFQSAPDGSFYAFFPDYFGGFGKRNPYWYIDDVEITNGGFSLNDENLATHVYVVGDTIPGGGITFVEKLQSGGVMTIFDAFKTNFLEREFLQDETTIKPKKVKKKKGKTPGFAGSITGAAEAILDSVLDAAAAGMSRGEAIDFLTRYGARPYYQDASFVKSPYFELLLAWQQWMLMWSKTFISKFEFTFMPEIYPGGIVAFKDHGIQCYVDEVVHTFDYENGFTTQAMLSAPASTGEATTDVNQGLVRGYALADTEPSGL